MVLLGWAVRLALVPLTSWGADTPSFVLAEVGFLSTGSPYGSGLYFNPPLGVLIDAPLFGLLSLVQRPAEMIVVYPSLFSVASHTAMISPLLPSAGALFALKLPLLVSDFLTGLLIFRLARGARGPRAAGWAFALWFLNPVVLWASAVHGEVDTFAALFLVAWLSATVERRPFLAGLALALAVFSKVYPVFVLPLALAGWIPTARAGLGQILAWRPVGRFAAGLGAGTLPFLAFLPSIASILLFASGSATPGGLTVLVVYNGAPPLVGGAGGLRPIFWEGVLRDLALVAVLLTVVYTLYLPGAGRSGGSPRPETVGAVALGAMVAGLLLNTSPQSENVLGLLALGAVAWPALKTVERSAVLVLAAAAFVLYLVLLGPLAYFYPLGEMLGPSAVSTISAGAEAYVRTRGVFAQANVWEVTGALGGLATLVLWAAPVGELFRRLLGRARGRR